MCNKDHNEAQVNDFVDLSCLVRVFVNLNKVICSHLVQLDLKALELIHSYPCVEDTLESKERDYKLI